MNVKRNLYYIPNDTDDDDEHLTLVNNGSKNFETKLKYFIEKRKEALDNRQLYDNKSTFYSLRNQQISTFPNGNDDGDGYTSSLGRFYSNGGHKSQIIHVNRQDSFCKRNSSFDNIINENNNTGNNYKSFKPVAPVRTTSLKFDQPNFDIESMQAVDAASQYGGTADYSCLRSNSCSTNFNNEYQSIHRLESCYKSIGTKVFVNKNQIELYGIHSYDLKQLANWSHITSGVPIWVFNTGINPKRGKCLSLIIAEKTAGFALFKIDSLTHESEFKKSRKCVLTFQIVKETRPVRDGFNAKVQADCTYFAIKFPSDIDCDNFYNYYCSLYNDCDNRDLFDPTFKSTKKLISVPLRKIKKASISQPCQFQHVNSITIPIISKIQNIVSKIHGMSLEHSTALF